MKPAARNVVGLIMVAAICGEAAADSPYARQGVLEVGGSALVNHSRRSSDFGGDTTTTRVRLQPILGYFVASGLDVFGGLLVDWEKEGGMGSGTTGLGILAGAGYYVPAGALFVGPRVQVAYARSKMTIGLDETTENGPSVQAAGALRIPFAFGGLLDLALALEYEKRHFNDSDEDIGDRSSLRLGAELGFFVFF